MMKIKKYVETPFLILILIIGLSVSEARADSKKELAEIYISFGKAKYDEALAKANKLVEVAKGDDKAMAFYWVGLIYSNKEEYDKAIPNFQNALKLKASVADIYYQLGQAFYATQEMEKAKVNFLKSIEMKFKPETSLYYFGYISYILENFKEALDSYRKIIDKKTDLEKMKKSAMFQYGEIKYFLLTEKKLKEVFEKEKVINEILPIFKKAKEYNEADQLTYAITARIAEIQKAHKIDPANRMTNGRLIPENPFTARIGLDLTYDSNILLRADETTAAPTDTGSFLTKINPFAKYQKDYKKKYFVAPEMGFSYKYHSRRDSPNIYKNDNYSIDPAIRNSYENTLFGEKASTMFEIEYNYTAQDYGSKKDLRYYSNSFQFILGEKFTYFKIGETTFQIKTKDKKSYTASSQTQTLTLNLSQLIELADGYSLTVSQNADFDRYAYAASSDTNTYKTTVSAVIPKKFYTYYSLAPTVNLTITNTRNSRPTKGLEKTFNPSVKLKRSWGGLNVDLSYGFTDKYSKDKRNSAYTKHELGIGTTYNF